MNKGGIVEWFCGDSRIAKNCDIKKSCFYMQRCQVQFLFYCEVSYFAAVYYMLIADAERLGNNGRCTANCNSRCY